MPATFVHVEMFKKQTLTTFFDIEKYIHYEIR